MPGKVVGRNISIRTEQYFQPTSIRNYSEVLPILNVVCCGIKNILLTVIRLRMSARQMWNGILQMLSRTKEIWQRLFLRKKLCRIVTAMEEKHTMCVLLLVPESIYATCGGRLFPDFIKNRKKTIRPTPTPMSIRRKNKTLVCGLNFRITDAPKPIFLLCRENGIIRKAVSG